jgi:hypothetical protein
MKLKSEIEEEEEEEEEEGERRIYQSNRSIGRNGSSRKEYSRVLQEEGWMEEASHAW